MRTYTRLTMFYLCRNVVETASRYTWYLVGLDVTFVPAVFL